MRWMNRIEIEITSHRNRTGNRIASRSLPWFLWMHRIGIRIAILKSHRLHYAMDLVHRTASHRIVNHPAYGSLNHPQITPNSPRNHPEITPKHPRNVPETSPKYLRNIPKISPKRPRNITETSPKHHRNNPKTSPKTTAKHP